MEETQEKQTVFSLVTRFFTIPLMIVAICIGVFYFFGRIAYEKKSVDDYLTEIQSGSANRRWQAAYELSKQIRQAKISEEKAEKIVDQLGRIYKKESDESDSRLRQYVILCLAQLGHPEALSVFKNSLQDSSADVVIYTLWGLGSLKESDVSLIEPFLTNEDPAIRKVSAFTLGVIGDPKTIPWLKETLKDSEPDVQWNGALALAQMGDSAGLEVIHQMLDPTYLVQFKLMTPPQKEALIESALKGVLLLNDKTAIPLLEQLAESEQRPSLVEQVRKTIDSLR